MSKIDKAAEHGALHRNNAARKKARAARIRAGAQLAGLGDLARVSRGRLRRRARACERQALFRRRSPPPRIGQSSSASRSSARSSRSPSARRPAATIRFAVQGGACRAPTGPPRWGCPASISAQARCASREPSRSTRTGYVHVLALRAELLGERRARSRVALDRPRPRARWTRASTSRPLTASTVSSRSIAPAPANRRQLLQLAQQRCCRRGCGPRRGRRSSTSASAASWSSSSPSSLRALEHPCGSPRGFGASHSCTSPPAFSTAFTSAAGAWPLWPASPPRLGFAER